MFQNLKKNENFEKSVENTGIEQHFIHLVNTSFDSTVKFKKMPLYFDYTFNMHTCILSNIIKIVVQN